MVAARNRSKRLIMAVGVGAALTALGSIVCAAVAQRAPKAQPAADWPTVGGDRGAMRHSILSQITPANVSRLHPVWTYHMKPAGTVATASSAADRAQAQSEQMGPGTATPLVAMPPAGGAQDRPPSSMGPFARGGRFAPSESIPLVVKGVMYLATPYSRIVALDARNGKELWVHQLPTGVNPSNRGLEYWPGSATVRPQILFGSSDGKLNAISAADGKPVATFGEGGSINLRTPEIMVGGANKPYAMSSPPVIFGNVVITGAAVGEAIGGSLGDVRGWDAVSGKLLWTFHSVPRKGEPGYETWANDSGHNRSGVNVWGLMSVDDQRGIVYMPFGAPANDRIGVDRPGNNLYGTSVVAADARTGKYIWHFQITHHDIWDNDAEASPTLFDVKQGGRTIPAVAIVSKNGLMFVLDRVTGKPIYPVIEHPVLASDVPGEMTSPTQPFPVKPAPLARMSMKPDEITDLTPELQSQCRKLVQDNGIAMGGPYNPPTYNRPMVYFPGTLGGVNWGGGAFDPKLGLFVVNAFELGQIMQITADGKGGFANRGPANGRFWDAKTRLLCQSGSWGDLVGVNVNTGDIVWRSRLGVSDNAPAGKQNTGRPSTGGPITTAGGLTFIAATDDGRFRAFETSTGKEMWTVKLPASAHTNPITYGANGQQYVAIVSTGGSFIGSPVESDALTVFGLN